MDRSVRDNGPYLAGSIGPGGLLRQGYEGQGAGPYRDLRMGRIGPMGPIEVRTVWGGQGWPRRSAALQNVKMRRALGGGSGEEKA